MSVHIVGSPNSGKSFSRKVLFNKALPETEYSKYIERCITRNYLESDPAAHFEEDCNKYSEKYIYTLCCVPRELTLEGRTFTIWDHPGGKYRLALQSLFNKPNCLVIIVGKFDISPLQQRVHVGSKLLNFEYLTPELLKEALINF